MSCERYASEIVDHACGAGIGSDAAEHLRTCAACRRLFDEQQRAIASLDQDLQSVFAIAPSPEFVPGVLARVRQPAIDVRRRLWWSVSLAAAAALLLLAFALLRPASTPVVERRDAAVVSPPVSAPAVEPTQPKPAPAEIHPATAVTSKAGERRRDMKPVGAVEPPAAAQAEVLVASDASDALARYLTLVRRGAIDTSTLTNPGEQGVAAPGALAIVPLAVDALAIAAVEPRNGSGDQREPHEP